MSNRIVVAGLDGATFRLLVPFVEEGLMPNLKALMDKGSWGSLMSTIPPLTSPAWGTLMTGKLPGKIGVFGFNDFIGNKYNPPIVNSTHIKSRMFWEIAGDSGKRVAVVNYPQTYPLRKLNGEIISGFLTPKTATDYFYPESLAEYLKDYPLDYPEPEPDDMSSYLEVLEEGLKKRRAVIEAMAKREKWDLFMFCLQEPDQMSHHLWSFFDESFSGYNSPIGEKVRASAKKMYSLIDETLGEVINELQPDAVMAVSDHGTGPAGNYSFNLNKLLIENKLLFSNRRSFHRIIYRNGPRILKKWLEKHHPNKISPVDFSRSRAWCSSYRCGTAAIFINTMGRYVNGCVNPGADYENLIEDIIKMLANITHNGGKVIDRICRREEIYKGEFADKAPDITVFLSRDYEIPNKFRNDIRASQVICPDLKRDEQSGVHEPDGIYVICGNAIKKSGRSASEGIESVAPTLTYLLGLPVPNDMDGSVMFNVIEDSFREANIPVSSDTRHESYNESTKSTDEEDQRMIEEQLKSLGYF
ncbi:MAG: alkaline phosphatase family protein [Nitrospirota bacterium]